MLNIIQHNKVTEIQMARPPVNALSPELIKAMRAAIPQALADGTKAIVLSGQPGMFSAGLDVPTLLSLDRKQLLAFWQDFVGLMSNIARSPIPVVAAIGGHSPAGGAVLALFCDYRVMAKGEFKIGLNEVQVGLPIPTFIVHAMGRLLGKHRAERLMVAGKMVSPDQALEIGMVDALAEVDQVSAHAITWCEKHLALPPLALAATRRIARADLHQLFDDPATLDTQEFADSWFSDETQNTLSALVAQLKAKSAAKK